MSSSARFVPGGSFNPDGSDEADAAGGSRDLGDTTRKLDEWEAVTRELDEERRERDEARRKALEGGEKSLFEILQDNKAAKQAAFEEQNKFKNQFRALDDDEVEFLDEVVAKRRREEERVRTETEERLRAFRDARRTEAASYKAAEAEAEKQDWSSLGRKRKRREREAIPGLRRASEDGGKKAKVLEEGREGNGHAGGTAVRTAAKKVGEAKGVVAVSAATVREPVKASLVAYGSDDDDDDDDDDNE